MLNLTYSLLFLRKVSYLVWFFTQCCTCLLTLRSNSECHQEANLEQLFWNHESKSSFTLITLICLVQHLSHNIFHPVQETWFNGYDFCIFVLLLSFFQDSRMPILFRRQIHIDYLASNACVVVFVAETTVWSYVVARTKAYQVSDILFYNKLLMM